MQDEESFEIEKKEATFFQGLLQAPKLNIKQNSLRKEIRNNSKLSLSQKNLKEKINQKIALRSESILPFDNNEEMKLKILVDGGGEAIVGTGKEKIKSFEQLGLIKALRKVIEEIGYYKPTPIQQLAIPAIISGKDVVGSSITGSGKTAAFLLPLLQRYFNALPVGYIRSVVVTPTRQLAIQIYEEFAKLNKYTKLQCVLAIGASSIQRQEQLLRNNPELLIATPGRLIDLLMNSKNIGIEHLEMLIFDEADKLLELGFEAEVTEIISHTNSHVQTVLFSATMGREVKQLALLTTRKPLRISADPDYKTAQKLHQQIVKLKEDSIEYREAVILSVLTNLYKQKVIVFFKTKKQCHRMAILLGLLGQNACELHGNLSQTQRIQAFLDFKEQKYDYLLATDLAARGLDIKDVKSVINFELPLQLTRYIHRVGRTARAGSVGASLTLCNSSESLQLKKMARKTGDRLFRLEVKEQMICKYRNTIRRLERQVEEILAEERQERNLRKADMELTKLQNISEHHEEIYSRPKKQWFLTEREKKQISKKSRQELGLQPSNNCVSRFTKSKKIHKPRQQKMHIKSHKEVRVERVNE